MTLNGRPRALAKLSIYCGTNRIIKKARSCPSAPFRLVYMPWEISPVSRLYFARRDRLFDFGDGLGHLNVSRTGVGAVENGAALPDAEGIGQHFQPLIHAIIARVEHEPMRLDDGCRADIAVVGPEAGAGRGAGGAENALGRIVETFAISL